MATHMIRSLWQAQGLHDLSPWTCPSLVDVYVPCEPQALLPQFLVMSHTHLCFHLSAPVLTLIPYPGMPVPGISTYQNPSYASNPSSRLLGPSLHS